MYKFVVQDLSTQVILVTAGVPLCRTVYLSLNVRIVVEGLYAEASRTDVAVELELFRSTS
jgi:hypothetical protein